MFRYKKQLSWLGVLVRIFKDSTHPTNSEELLLCLARSSSPILLIFVLKSLVRKVHLSALREFCTAAQKMHSQLSADVILYLLSKLVKAHFYQTYLSKCDEDYIQTCQSLASRQHGLQSSIQGIQALFTQLVSFILQLITAWQQ